jgi:hypothetical protein
MDAQDARPPQYQARGADDQVHVVVTADAVPPYRTGCGRTALRLYRSPVVTTCSACSRNQAPPRPVATYEPCG